MRALALLCVTLLAAAPLRAQVTVPPEVQDDDDSTQAVGGAGTHQGKADKAPGANGADDSVSEGFKDASKRASAGSSSQGSSASGSPPVKVTHVAAYDNIPAMPEHQGAHGLVRLGGPGQAVAVGVTAYSVEELNKLPGGGASGACLLNFGPRASSDPSCDLFVWMSERPGGPAVSDKCRWRSYIISDVTIGGHWFTTLPGQTGKSLAGACVLPKNGQRYYCNIAATGWDKADPPKKCDAVLNFPMDTMPQDLYPDSIPH